jgi:hypothetical protein
MSRLRFAKEIMVTKLVTVGPEDDVFEGFVSFYAITSPAPP